MLNPTEGFLANFSISDSSSRLDKWSNAKVNFHPEYEFSVQGAPQLIAEYEMAEDEWETEELAKYLEDSPLTSPRPLTQCCVTTRKTQIL